MAIFQISEIIDTIIAGDIEMHIYILGDDRWRAIALLLCFRDEITGKMRRRFDRSREHTVVSPVLKSRRYLAFIAIVRCLIHAMNIRSFVPDTRDNYSCGRFIFLYGNSHEKYGATWIRYCDLSRRATIDRNLKSIEEHHCNSRSNRENRRSKSIAKIL